MNCKALIALVVVLLITTNMVDAQRFERSRPVSIKDQILMKLDSIDLIYFSRLRSRDRYEAKRRIDAVAQLVDRLTEELRDKELALAERERVLQKREAGIEERDRDRNRNREDDRDIRQDRGDRDNKFDKEDVRISPMGLQEFNQLIGSIEKTPFDQDKKKIARTAAMSNYFLVDQVIRLTSKFSFDNDKLDVIEILYPRILDLDKNYLLYNCFTFSDGKNKLEKFIDGNSMKGKP